VQAAAQSFWRIGDSAAAAGNVIGFCDAMRRLGAGGCARTAASPALPGVQPDVELAVQVESSSRSRPLFLIIELLAACVRRSTIVPDRTYGVGCAVPSMVPLPFVPYR